jgi:hypothetical protein
VVVTAPQLVIYRLGRVLKIIPAEGANGARRLSVVRSKLSASELYGWGGLWSDRPFFLFHDRLNLLVAVSEFHDQAGPQA